MCNHHRCSVCPWTLGGILRVCETSEGSLDPELQNFVYAHFWYFLSEREGGGERREEGGERREE
jgi:hypothetical protein